MRRKADATNVVAGGRTNRSYSKYKVDAANTTTDAMAAAAGGVPADIEDANKVGSRPRPTLCCRPPVTVWPLAGQVMCAGKMPKFPKVDRVSVSPIWTLYCAPRADFFSRCGRAARAPSGTAAASAPDNSRRASMHSPRANPVAPLPPGGNRGQAVVGRACCPPRALCSARTRRTAGSPRGTRSTQVAAWRWHCRCCRRTGRWRTP